MKKLVAFSAAILFAGILSLSVLAFTDGEPKKEKSASASTEQCEKHKGTTADAKAEGTAEAKDANCDKAKGSTASAGCGNHKETTADTE
jgi:hypothetical protein